MSEQFSVPSTRATVVSVAFDKGISLADIMRTANLSQTHHSRDFIPSVNIVIAVLSCD